MSKEVVALIVGGVVAVGTLVYYLFFDEKEQPMPVERGRRGAYRSSAFAKPSISTLQEYPKSTVSSKPTPLYRQAQRKSIPDSSDPLNGSNSPVNSTSPEPSRSRVDSISPEPSGSPVYPSSPISSVQNTCKVCDKRANAKFLPCEHRNFCREHADEYKRLGALNSVIPKCPECRDVVESIE